MKKQQPKSNAIFFIAPLAVTVVAVLGSFVTERNMDWYETIALPLWAPSGSFIGFVWTVIFILAAASLALAWRGTKTGTQRRRVALLFLINGALNVAWSAVFFGAHDIQGAALVALALAASVAAIMSHVYECSRAATWLLLPYLLWGCFATYLNYVIANLN